MKKNLEAVADAFSAEKNFVVESTSEWVKVSDKFLWENVVAYVEYDEEGEEYTYSIHTPAEWNGVIESSQMQDFFDFVKEVEDVLNNLD